MISLACPQFGAFRSNSILKLKLKFTHYALNVRSDVLDVDHINLLAQCSR